MPKSKDASNQPLLAADADYSTNTTTANNNQSYQSTTISAQSFPRTTSQFESVKLNHNARDGFVGGDDDLRHRNNTLDNALQFNPNDDDGKDGTNGDVDAPQQQDRLRYLSYYLPITTWLPKYQPGKQLMKDVIAGLSVGAMLTPQSLSYASILHLPPIHGLITALIAGIVYFFLGHSPILTVGPEATTSILLGEAILSIPIIKHAKETNAENFVQLCYIAVSAISFITGMVTLLFGLFRLGFVDGVFSRPVLSGFICAVGLQLLIDQTPKVMGLPACHECENTWQKLGDLFDKIFLKWDVNYCAMVIGISCILFLAIFKYLKSNYPNNLVISRTPHIFILVVVITLLSYIFDFEGHFKILIIGKGNSTIPSPKFPTLYEDSETFSKYLSTAIILAVLGFVETQLVNKTIQIPGTTISPNRELVALGTMHMVASCFGGYAAYGSLTRTRVSLLSGTTSQIANLIAISMVLVSIVVLMDFFAYMPTAVTGGIVWFVATSLIETHETVFTFQTKQWLDFGLNLIMIVVTLFFGVDIGLFFAFAICLLLVIKQQNKPSVRLLGRFNHTTPTVDSVDDVNQSQQGGNEEYVEFNEHAKLHESALEGILIYQIDGPLFFCNAENLKDRMRRIEMFGSVLSHPSQPPHPLDLKAIIFDLQSVTSIDATAAAVLLELVEDYQKRDIQVIFVKLRRSLLPLMVDAGVVKKLGMSHFKRSIQAATELIEQTQQAKTQEQQEQQEQYVDTV